MSIQPYDYDTDHIRWHIFEDIYEYGHLERFIPVDLLPPYGGRLVHVGIYGSALEAERHADAVEWAEHPVERDAPEPIPLVRDAA